MTTRSLLPHALRLDLRSRTGAAVEPAERHDGPSDAIPSLVGWIEPADRVDASLLRDMRLHRADRPHFYWEDPDGGIVLGWGAVSWFEGRGEDRFDAARRWIERLAASATLSGAPRGPRPENYLVAAGGFAFSSDGRWGSGFESATFVVPRTLVHLRRDIGAVRIAWRRREEPAGADLPDASSPWDGRADGAPPALDEALASRAEWEGAVSKALAGIEGGSLEKVVVARRVSAALGPDFDPLDVLDRLHARHPGCYRFLFDFGRDAQLLGASPERLVTLRGARLSADAIAGTAPRPEDSAAEAAASLALRSNAKDRLEHEPVVRHVREALAPFATELAVEESPEVQRLRTLLHLRTRVTATAAAGTHVLDVARRLHPTPAVAGSPPDTAVEWIASLEGADRGWYAGAVGWMTAGGDGDFAVALRSAFVSRRRALLAAGAGIVPGSDPGLEWAETEAKLSAMRDALGDA